MNSCPIYRTGCRTLWQATVEASARDYTENHLYVDDQRWFRDENKVCN